MPKSVFVCLCLMIVCLCPSSVDGKFEPYHLGALHEAYVSRDDGTVGFMAIAETPPDPVLETPPTERPEGSVWIPGYWSWTVDEKEFVWVAGVWRNPPPGMDWVPGVWRDFPGLGWVWLNGFWSNKALVEAKFIKAPPPDVVAEIPGFPESANYFWIQGYWVYREKSQKYEWIGGTWMLLDPLWVLVPGHYEWRTEGYIFVPAYWDWPLEQRGVSYEPVLVPKINRYSEFKPATPRKESAIYQLLITHYPNHLYLCQHIFHYHPDRWLSIAPPWWQWHSWWSLPWQDQWGLWWWYTHPGYPEPLGLTRDMSEKMRAANPRLLQMVVDVAPPFVITSKGAVPPEAIWKVLKTGENGDVLPILPADPKAVAKIQERALKETMSSKKEVPLGKEIDPSKRGKLYGVRETVSSQVQQSPHEASFIVKPPAKPEFIGGRLQDKPMEMLHEEQVEGQKKNKPVNVDIDLVPVKTLKEMRAPANKRQKNSVKHIPSPDKSIIHQVLPGPRVGPAIELEDNE